MTNEEIISARTLIAAVGEPQGQYAEEVMKLFRQLLDGHEAANLKISELRVALKRMALEHRECHISDEALHLAHMVLKFTDSHIGSSGCNHKYEHLEPKGWTLVQCSKCLDIREGATD